MFKKTITILAGTGLALAMGAASAAPQELSESQMDNVTGGYYSWYSHADANAGSLSFGPYAATYTGTHTFTGPYVASSNSSSSAVSTSCFICAY